MLRRMGFRKFLQSGRVLLCSLALIFFGSACKPSHEDAKKIKRVEPQLNVPVPEARAKSADERLDWNMETSVDAYDKVGDKNPKWNTFAHDALKLFAQVRSYGSDIEGYPGVARTCANRALELGCNDPLIKYLNARLGDWSKSSVEEYVKVFTAAADAMESSPYPPVRKFYAATRAYNSFQHMKKVPPEAYNYLKLSSRHLQEMLSDRHTPAPEADDACGEFLSINKWGDMKERYDEMEALLEKNWSNHAFTYLMEGQFYVDWAWRGRSGKYAKDVTEEQWKMFFDRLGLAEQRLRKGMEIDPKEGRIPSLMIKVVSGENKGLPEMKEWWAKAMEANPNNYEACDQLLYFLMPRWFGSRKAMIAFGRECWSSDKFGGTVPLILADAHDTYNRYDGAKDGSYWKEPDV